MVSASMLFNEGSLTVAVVNVVGRAEGAAAGVTVPVTPAGAPEGDGAVALQAASIRTRSMV
jgi:hypothetical protein